MINYEKVMQDCVQNAPERPEYCSVLKALQPVLFGLPPVIVAIDGRAGVGKTTLGRFLSWRFNVSLLESDLFLVKNQGKFSYRNEDVRGVIQSRLSGDRPIIVEGVVSLSLLATISFTPAFHIRVNCAKATGSSEIEEIWRNYVQELKSTNLKGLVLELPILK